MFSAILQLVAEIISKPTDDNASIQQSVEVISPGVITEQKPRSMNVGTTPTASASVVRELRKEASPGPTVRAAKIVKTATFYGRCKRRLNDDFSENRPNPQSSSGKVPRKICMPSRYNF